MAPITDTMDLTAVYDNVTGLLPFDRLLQMWFTDGATDKQLPGMVGMHLAGVSFLMINSPELVKEVFVDLAKYVTKNPWEQQLSEMFLGNGIFFKPSEHKDFPTHRKALSSSLFKNKLVLMMKEIKRVTFQHLKRYKDTETLDITDFFL